MKVRLLIAMAGARGSKKKGDVIDLPEEAVAEWLKLRRIELIEEPTPADDDTPELDTEPEPEEKPKRKRKSTRKKAADTAEVAAVAPDEERTDA